ncbi:uncharacterized protein PHACADRAFT_256697 [Phanerochaete carnosa HHB-10118-sp]|uniref:Gpi1-domain-containing protein n=1 Tax=Phanerochaete carnosa (strain HHB-10118-sp) TaxID=650164 RepID=K5VW98_PHACS|nr:uncharacterized protein PHACADRAFT_256697 [Phanerochaete carnosa HHB-10118-sp]EKM55808.1 hypothetical protein PHACADRAFT_256697 [Phanerochaete carnosa HHB-10118-sp]
MQADHARDLLELLIAQSEVAAPNELFGALPVILGRCTVAKRHSKLSFFDAAYNAHRLVFYTRPDLRRMQIYTLHAQLQLFKLSASLSPRQGSPCKTCPGALFCLDPTHLSIPSTLIQRPETIHQLNYGQLLTRSPRCANGPRHILLPSAHLRRFWELASMVVSTCGKYQPPCILSVVWHCSVLLSQVSTRFLQVISLPADYPQLTPVITTALISQYVMFYNCIWLILNDIIIGWALGTIICEHATSIASVLEERIRTLLIGDLQWALLWLNNWPAGLKLNGELSQFYCHLLLAAVTGWNRLLQTLLLPYLPQLIYFAGAVGSCGITLTVSICSDLLVLTTAHVHLCYHISRFVYQQQLNIVSSLWNLSRGKRYNVLRHRVDSWSYDLDQLLFGTILFTLTAFISPTTFTYYALFATLQLVTSLILALLNAVLVLVNQFPLFALLLRIKDPQRLPGGIVLTLGEDGSSLRIEVRLHLFVHHF